MSLGEEKDILRQINKLQQQKIKLDEFNTFDAKVKHHRAMTGQLRDSMRNQNATISALRTELNTIATAVELGCHVKELVGTKLECPTDKIGPIIGKKGKNLQSIQSSSHVTIDVQREGDIRLVGTKASIEKAKMDLVKVIERTEEMVELSSKLREYLVAYKITALSELRDRHPDVYFNVTRNSDQEQISVRGSPPDIAALKRTMEEMQIIETAIRLSSRETGMLVGKGGGNINSLIELHQVVIDVQRPQKNGDIGETITRVKLLGPKENVEAAKAAIDTMVTENKDSEEKIVLHPHIRTLILMNGGKGIQSIRKNVNDAINATVGEDAPSSAGVYVGLNVVEDGIVVKARARVLEKAKRLTMNEVSALEDLLVSVKVDPFLIPVIIGKGGQGIQKLREGTATTSIEINRDEGDITVCGTDADEIKTVVAAVEAIKESNHVKRITLMCDDSDDGPSSFGTQIKNYFRSAVAKEVQELVFMSAEDDLKQIVLRGKPDELAKAVELVEKFVSLNQIEELCLSEEDVDALLAGGKESKVAQLSKELNANLNVDREKQLLVCKGEKEAVTKALAAAREFLFGGEDIVVRKVILSSPDLKGVVIGKGGKTMAELQDKFPSVSISMHRSEPLVTLRGPTDEVQECHVAVLKIVLGANVTKTMNVTGKQVKSLQKSNFHRRLGQSLNVMIYVAEEDCIVTIKGAASDVDEANKRMSAELKGTFESHMKIGGGLFQRIKDATKNPAHFERIRKDSRAEVTLDAQTESIVFSGKEGAVKKAKQSMVTFLQFLLGENMESCTAQSQILTMVGKPFTLGEIEARTGAKATLDRDLESILVYGGDTEKTKAAVDLIQAKITECQKQVHICKLDKSEDWLIASIIGKGGANIKKLRQEASGCSIDIQNKDMQIVLSSDDPEVVSKGREVMENFIETARKECVFVSIPHEDLPAFVGRAGAHIRKLSETYEVELQIMKSQGDALRITGPEEKVSAAQAGVEAWLAAREAEELANNIEESKRLRPDQIPLVIGNRGTVINALSKEFECRIDIDRLNSSVVARGGTPEKRAALFEKIQQIVSGEVEEYAGSELRERPSGTTSRQAAPKANKMLVAKTEFDYEKLLQAGNNFPTLPGAPEVSDTPKQLEMNWPTVKPVPPEAKTPSQSEEEDEEEEEDLDDGRDWRKEYYGVSW